MANKCSIPERIALAQAIVLAPIGQGRASAGPVIAPRLVIAPRPVIAPKELIAPKEVIAPRQLTAVALPARETGAGAIPPSRICRRGGRPIFSRRVVDRVLPVQAFPVQAFLAVAAAVGLPVAAAAAVVVGLPVVAAAAAAVADGAPISR